MFSELQDYGIILISIAFFGFMVSNAFRTGLYLFNKTTYRNNIEKIFRYIIIAIFGLFFMLVLIRDFPGYFLVKSILKFFELSGLNISNLEILYLFLNINFIFI